MHDSMGVMYKKFHLHEVTTKLNDPGSGLWFALKSGIIFDKNELMIIGDAMDVLHHGYRFNTTIKSLFLRFEGYTMFYNNHGREKKMTLSGPEISFLNELIDHFEQQINSKAA